MKRIIAAVVAAPFLVLALAAPAPAAKPDTPGDPQGCEMQNAGPLGDYCHPG